MIQPSAVPHLRAARAGREVEPILTNGRVPPQVLSFSFVGEFRGRRSDQVDPRSPLLDLAWANSCEEKRTQLLNLPPSGLTFPDRVNCRKNEPNRPGLGQSCPRKTKPSLANSSRATSLAILSGVRSLEKDEPNRSPPHGLENTNPSDRPRHDPQPGKNEPNQHASLWPTPGDFPPRPGVHRRGKTNPSSPATIGKNEATTRDVPAWNPVPVPDDGRKYYQ